MEPEQKQLWTYLNWLLESGQVYAREGEVLPGSPGDFDLPSVDPAPAAPAPRKLIFFSARPLDDQERVMVDRIAAALGLQPADFAIGTPEDTLMGEILVFLGADAEKVAPKYDPSLRLTIPHPSAMLQEPSLKRSAWDSLQTLKSRLG